MHITCLHPLAVGPSSVRGMSPCGNKWVFASCANEVTTHLRSDDAIQDFNDPEVTTVSRRDWFHYVTDFYPDEVKLHRRLSLIPFPLCRPTRSNYQWHPCVTETTKRWTLSHLTLLLNFWIWHLAKLGPASHLRFGIAWLRRVQIRDGIDFSLFHGLSVLAFA